MIDRGRAVQERREALGLSREKVSSDTRIPVQHVTALEEGRVESLPAGPYAESWLRTLEEYVGLPTGESAGSESPAAPGQLPLWGVRIVAGLALGALIAAVVWQLMERGSPSVQVGAAATPVEDQQLSIRAVRTTRVAVIVDGELAHEGELAGGQELEFSARERIEVDVRAAGALKIDFNGDRIVPQGRQDEPRRLVFVDDGGGR